MSLRPKLLISRIVSSNGRIKAKERIAEKLNLVNVTVRDRGLEITSQEARRSINQSLS